VVTSEPSVDQAVKRLAARVEDHLLAHAGFSSTIPQGLSGAGQVSVWDRRTFENLGPAGTIAHGLAAGKLSFVLHGRRLKGRLALVRVRGEGKRENWLFIKGRDQYAQPGAAAAESARRRRPSRPVSPAQETPRGAAPDEATTAGAVNERSGTRPPSGRPGGDLGPPALGRQGAHRPVSSPEVHSNDIHSTSLVPWRPARSGTSPPSRVG
jgi:bifunctional non-homologous end joining protein LigD